MTKEDLINAIIGKGFTSIEQAMDMRNRGLARWTGNQHNESWDWNRKELEKLGAEELEAIYRS